MECSLKQTDKCNYKVWATLRNPDTHTHWLLKCRGSLVGGLVCVCVCVTLLCSSVGDTQTAGPIIKGVNRLDCDCVCVCEIGRASCRERV